MKNPSHSKKMFFLFLATILIMVLIWKNDHPIAEYAKTGVRLSDLSEQECKVIDMKMIDQFLIYEITLLKSQRPFMKPLSLFFLPKMGMAIWLF